MLVRATLNLRNEKMIGARERLGISQKHAAILAETSLLVIAQLEKFNYAIGRNARQIADRVALALELSADDVMPPELEGKQFQSAFTRQTEIDLKQLPAPIDQRLICDAGAEGVEVKDLLAKAMGRLSYREREIIKLRYGIGGSGPYTYEEVARIFKVTRERVRQVEAKALVKLKASPLLLQTLESVADVFA